MYKQIAVNKRKSFLLVIVFIILIISLGWLAGEITQSGYSFLFLAVMISLAMTLTSYYSGDKIALWSAGAQGPIKKQDNPYLYRLVENLSITIGQPVPKIYIIPDPAPNAFATGRDPQHASLAVTSGLMNLLENEELEGVLAHELSHIKNYDIRFMMIVAVLVGTLVLLADLIFRWGFFFGHRRDNRSEGPQPILLTIGLILVILSPLIGQLIKLAVSRKREFLADASAALITRYPAGLARALEKISAYQKPLQRASRATAHLYITNPFGAKTASFLNKLFSTHPPIEERIKALRSMV